MLNVGMYVIGWLLFLLAQIHNSVQSSSNGLPTGWQGMRKWLDVQYVNVITRAFFSAVFYPALVQSALTKLSGPLSAAGLAPAEWGMAGIAGYSSCALLNQAFGLIPGLRKEMPAIVPPEMVSLDRIMPDAPPKG